MNADTWLRMKPLFQQALEQPLDQRRAWLEQAAMGDADLVAQVWDLLDVSETLGGFLETPIAVPTEDVAGWLEPGTRVGVYDIVREIGRGGMGVVYLARDTTLVRDVALKALPPEASADPVNRARLTLEAQAAAKISHPSVATVYAFAEIGGQLFIASEYVDGRSLRDLIAGGPLPVERAVALTLDIADALHAAHEAGVVHRDLKPDNVLLTRAGAVKVVDFGIARVLGQDGTRLTQHGAVIGTPAYMAPEQLAGAAGDARADVYALGLVLAEMLAGHHPLRDGAAPAPPPLIAPIIARCLQPDPSARFPSAAALRDALAGAGRGEAAGAPRARWWWQFHQAVTAVVYALLFVPAGVARRAAGGSPVGGQLRSWLFATVLAAGIIAITLRLHLLFVSRSGARAVNSQRALSRRWLRVADLTFAAGLALGGLLIEEGQPALAILLIAAGAAAAVAAVVIEPATSRAAFDD